MASIGFLIGGALVNALAFTGSNYLFSTEAAQPPLAWWGSLKMF